MNTLRIARLVAALVIAVCVLALTGCAKQQAAQTGHFATPEAAVEAFVTALRTHDRAALRDVLGPEADALLNSGDEVQSARERDAFLLAFDEHHSLAGTQANSRTLEVGNGRWPMPIPLVRRDGSWQFDAASGADELVLRRIGRNELAAIDVCYGVVAAQLEYESKNGAYATKVLSDPGKRNGLYWEAKQGEPSSPAGPLLALASAEGYDVGKKPTPYHGYIYRSLPAAAGDDAHKGYALVAYPAEYGASGVMTFIVNQDGVVYQSDLGEDTATKARALSGYSVGDGWSPADS